MLRVVAAGVAAEGRGDARLPLLGIGVLAFALRLGLWVARAHGLVRSFEPPLSFWLGGNPEWTVLAENLALGKGYHFLSGDFGDFWANRPPLYPLTLAALYHLFGRADLPPVVLQSVIGALSAVLACLISRRLFGRRAGLIAGVLVALYPYYLNHDVFRQETVLLTCVTAAGVFLVLRAREASTWRDPAGAGVMLGLAALTRLTLLPFVPLAAVWLGAFSARRRAWGVVLLLVGAVTVITPWVVRNTLLLGRPVFSVSTGFGLWWGHNPGVLKSYPWESIDRGTLEYWRSLPLEVRERVAALPELERDRWWREQAWGYIKANPLPVARGVGLKALVALGLVKSPASGDFRDILYPALYVPLLLSAAFGACMRPDLWPETALFVLLFLAHLVPSLLAWSHSGHRIYLDLYLMVLASVPLAAAVTRVSGSSAGPKGDRGGRR